MHIIHEIAMYQDIVIAFLYWVIAMQFWRRSKLVDTKAKRAFFLLIAIFALCGINGYIMHAFGMFAIVEIIRVTTMVPLILATGWYVQRGMVYHITDALERDSIKVDNTIEIYKESLKKKQDGI